ncbi:CotH kinase family protein [Bacillus sp. FJAT-22090]|uniref:CotH kinase family protein n=1 Tax=Bacillus sp. FJAT-22090 TaxID=1581038 RepID=UPI00119EFDD1|nr:CotH kinase family protein [Bacillus sp. FJAT-22090]
MKKTPVILVFVILIVLFCSAVFVYPKLGLESANTGYKYMDTVFDQSQVTNVDIEMEDEDFNSMIENAADEEIFEANVTVNGTTVNNVGIRTKGNLSLRSVVQMEDSDRYSFKIDFDYYDSTKSLDGLKKLNLNNNYSDASQMREYMSYKMMDELGIATPGYSYMYVKINGEERGLYLGVEAIEETFLARTFDKGSGSLYKPDGTGSDLKYISDAYEDYTGIDPKTSIGDKDEEEFIDFITAINKESTDLESVLDVDEMLRYFAANTALVNLDSYQGNMKHNYYLYEEDGIFSILPWDYNMSLGGFGGGGNRGQGGFPKQGNENTSPPENNEVIDAAQGQTRQQMGMMGGNALNDSNINFSIYEPVSGMSIEERPLINSLLSSEENVSKYEDYISEIASTFLAKEKFTQMVDEVYNLIRPYVEKDPTAFYTTEEFQADVYGDTGIIEFASKRSDSILAQISGDLVVESTDNLNGSSSEIGLENFSAPQSEFPPNDGKMPEGMEPPNGKQLPEGMQGGPDNRQMPDGNGENTIRAKFGEKGTADKQSTGYSKTMIVTTAVSLALMLLLTFGISRFRRRKV